MAVSDPAAPFARRGAHFVIDLPGARVVFTTRAGGVSQGPYASLNLGYLTEDRAEAVAANRAALERELGVRTGFVRQVHGSRVRRLTRAEAERERRAPPGSLIRADGQVTSEPGVAAAALTADCLAVAIAGEGAVAMVHAGWRGLHEGVIAAGVSALCDGGAEGRLTAAVGPGAGPCCYEVGADVHAAFADRPAAVHVDDRLDLAAIARHDLEAAGVSEVHVIGLCTICSGLFFSHRRDRGVTGRQAGDRMVSLIEGLTAERVAANLARVRERISQTGRDPDGVQILAATKYLPAEAIAALVAGGVSLAGENRAQELADKRSAPGGDALTWDFIGQLQSRKVRDLLPAVRYIHSVASDSALAQLTRHGTASTRVLVEVNVSGDAGKAGVDPAELSGFLERCPVTVVGLMTMPPLTDDPDASRPHFGALRELAEAHGLSELSMGTSQDYVAAVAEGATIVRLGTILYAGAA